MIQVASTVKIGGKIKPVARADLCKKKKAVLDDIYTTRSFSTVHRILTSAIIEHRVKGDCRNCWRAWTIVFLSGLHLSSHFHLIKQKRFVNIGSSALDQQIKNSNLSRKLECYNYSESE